MGRRIKQTKSFWFDSNKIYTIDTDGNEEYFKYLDINYKTFVINGMVVQLEFIDYKKLDNDAFEARLKYDKIINCQSIIFDYETFYLTFDKNKNNDIAYEINLFIKKNNKEFLTILNLL